MRKSFFVFLIGVVGGTLWLVLQKYDVRGLQQVRLEPRRAASAHEPAFVTVTTPANTTRASLRLATFNIQVFGRSKLDKPMVTEILARIVRQFDLVAIQEVRSRDDDILPRFIEMLNADGRHYDFVIGPRLGRTNSKEQYAVVFDQETLEVDRSQLYTIHDPDDVLHREPLVAWFRARGAPPDQAFTFSVVSIHTDPDEVSEEIDVLDDAFYAVRNDGRLEDDVILLGDFNADDKHLGELGHVTNLHTAVSSVATNVAGDRQLDNILFDRQATREFTGRSGVFDFLRAYDMTIESAREVSDHLPVWAEFSVLEGGQYGRIAAR